MDKYLARAVRFAKHNPNAHVAVVYDKYSTVRNILAYCKENVNCTVFAQTNTLRFKNNSVVELLVADGVKRYAGKEFSHMVVDEMSNLTLEDERFLASRVRSRQELEDMGYFGIQLTSISSGGNYYG